MFNGFSCLFKIFPLAEPFFPTLCWLRVELCVNIKVRETIVYLVMEVRVEGREKEMVSHDDEKSNKRRRMLVKHFLLHPLIIIIFLHLFPSFFNFYSESNFTLKKWKLFTLYIFVSFPRGVQRSLETSSFLLLRLLISLFRGE